MNNISQISIFDYSEMKILIAGFEGDDNSAKILLDEIKQESNNDILYLKNDFEMSSQQIQQKLLQNYDYVLIFRSKTKYKNNIFRK